MPDPTDRPAPTQRTRGVRTELPVLLTLLACTFTVTIDWLHVLTGLGLIAAAGWHLGTRRGWWARLTTSAAAAGARIGRPFRHRLRRRGSAVLGALAVAATIAVLVTGVQRWVGVAARTPGTAAPGGCC